MLVFLADVSHLLFLVEEQVCLVGVLKPSLLFGLNLVLVLVFLADVSHLFYLGEEQVIWWIYCRPVVYLD